LPRGVILAELSVFISEPREREREKEREREREKERVRERDKGKSFLIFLHSTRGSDFMKFKL
jgi:1-acyl-sn-glycerol-3-phosphate acyltransferase